MSAKSILSYLWMSPQVLEDIKNWDFGETE